MAQIRPSNTREFRYKAQIVEDLVNVMTSTTLSPGTKFAMYKQVAWVWTEYHGKYLGCPYWSKDAIDWYLQNPTSKQDVIAKHTTHEHLVPRNYFYTEMDRLERSCMSGQFTITPMQIYSLCENLLIGVVVMRGEDNKLNKNGLRQKMPAGFKVFPINNLYDHLDPWCRYSQTSVNIGVHLANKHFVTNSQTKIVAPLHDFDPNIGRSNWYPAARANPYIATPPTALHCHMC